MLPEMNYRLTKPLSPFYTALVGTSFNKMTQDDAIRKRISQTNMD